MPADADTRGKLLRQPVHGVRVVGGVELVERVEDEDHAPGTRRLAQELGELLDEFLDVLRDGIAAARGACRLMAKPAKRAAQIGRAGAGTDEVGKNS